MDFAARLRLPICPLTCTNIPTAHHRLRSLAGICSLVVVASVAVKGPEKPSLPVRSDPGIGQPPPVDGTAGFDEHDEVKGSAHFSLDFSDCHRDRLREGDPGAAESQVLGASLVDRQTCAVAKQPGARELAPQRPGEGPAGGEMSSWRISANSPNQRSARPPRGASVAAATASPTRPPAGAVSSTLRTTESWVET